MESLKKIDKTLNLTQPFKNKCGIRNGKIENWEDFINCSITLMSVISFNPAFKSAPAGVKLLKEAVHGYKLIQTATKL